VYKTSQGLQFIVSITFLLSLLCSLNEVCADEIKTWVRGPAEIMVDGYTNERDFCEGTESEMITLDEGHFLYKKYAHHPLCGKQYDLSGTIVFDSPPLKIVAGSSVHLTAEGEMSGYQSCCFLYHWFTYGVSCTSQSVPDLDDTVFLDLRTLESGPITIPDTDNATGYQGMVEDEIDVILTIPETGTECTVTGRGEGGLWIRWIYEMVTETAPSPNVRITEIRSKNLYYTDDNKFYDLEIILSNDGSADSGVIEITFPDDNEEWLSDKISIPYTITANTQKSYRFHLKFPKSIKKSSRCTDDDPLFEDDPPKLTGISIQAETFSSADGPGSQKKNQV